MKTGAETDRWIQLHHENDQTPGVLITPGDEDRFPLSMSSAIRGCRLANKLDVHIRQFRDLLPYLAQWLAAHEDRIDRAYVGTRDGGLLFLIVQAGRRYDAVLEDELTQLDISIAQNEDFNAIELSVLSLPQSDQDAVPTFLSPNFFYAKRSDTPSPGESQSGSDRHAAAEPR